MNNTNQPQSIVVPSGGIILTAVLPALGLSFDQVNPLLGYELGSPRDYSMPAGAQCVVFNAGGVQRLASLFGIAVEVVEEKLEGGALSSTPEAAPVETEVTTDPHGRERGPWYRKGDLA